ncbi:hypothetical protein [Ovoidimarina sediminis]|nr:hypothetical protein [Rhodophyticola sp. MJ-SS7]MDU8941906.1 hypothetical protein [Rhodophyticola sp. MJ-SS7]
MRTNETQTGFSVMTDLYKDHLVSVALIALSLFAASYLIAEIGVF